MSSGVEKNATEYSINSISEKEANFSTKRQEKYANYLDSISDQKILGFTTYTSAKSKELNKGLDLKGGINVILQISVKDILLGLAENSRDPIFNNALNNADELQKDSNETKRIPLKFIVYAHGYEKGLEASSQGAFLTNLKKWGFKTNPLNKTFNNISDLFLNYSKN